MNSRKDSDRNEEEQHIPRRSSDVRLEQTLTASAIIIAPSPLTWFSAGLKVKNTNRWNEEKNRRRERDEEKHGRRGGKHTS